jgi:hypothetical protein
LLRDGDRRVVDACRQHLLRWGSIARDSLETAAQDEEPRLRLRARSLIRSLDIEEWLLRAREFALMFPSGPAARSDHRGIEEGVDLLCSIAGVMVGDVREFRDRLDELGARLKARLRTRTAAAAARLLSELLCTEQQLTGVRSRAHALEDVIPHRVLDRRRGGPTALGIVYILIGRRANLPLSGVRMPDYFLVRVHGSRPVILDPFHEGRTVTKTDCIRYLRRAGYGFQPSFLEEADDRAILLALLEDLRGVYGYREDREICVALRQAKEAFAP